MSIKTFVAAIALGSLCALAPTSGSAGGELQSYERPYTGYRTTTDYQAGTYAAPMPANYARPMAMYGQGYGCGMSPCGTMPYGAPVGGYSRGYGVGGNDVFTAGLLGIGLGYLIFH